MLDYLQSHITSYITPDITSYITPHITPFIAIVGYLLYPKNLRINPLLLYGFSIIHNGALIVFSAWSCYSLSQVLYNKGLVIQTNYYFQDPQFDMIMYLFYMSKYYEFFDTFLLYLNNKTPIFLQKYHHIGAVICWHLAYTYKADGVWIPSIINSFIHTIMYSYYLGTLLKIDYVKRLKKYITTIQLSQFLFCSPSTLYFYLPIETGINKKITILFNLYNIGLIILFFRFYYVTYYKVKIN